MERIIGFFSKLSEQVDRVIVLLVFLLLTGMVLVTTLQIVFRVAFTALSWSEELSRYLLVWSTFFASTMAYKRGNHIAVTFLIEALPKRLSAAFSALSYLLSVLFFVVAANYSWEMITMQVFQTSPAMGMSMQFVYASIPLSSLIMILHALPAILKQFAIMIGKEASI